MGRVADSDIKSRLVSEIFSFSTTSIDCSHRCSSTTTNTSFVESHFIDWYRLLGVGEDAGIDVIRKRYHKLALQLHPDKNKHPKAETAFKLISEAYTCLSDNAKRRAFNLERWKRFCIECNRIPYTSCKSSPKDKDWKPANFSRSYKILRNLRNIKERFREEAKVIENCLSANATTSGKESPFFSSTENLLQSQHRTPKESPIFNPSDYCFQGYPHLRNRIYMKPDDFWYFHRESTHKYGKGREVHDSPIFENRSEREMYKSKSTCVRS
ncbi:hypothetical protein Pint_24443 [Pistacia integerrima]|uniref:Uncharacterized protein n=1 Tax=Pistacia integerrima TaxID=434235 RepID=A0ACC0YHF2_9ROSI|nr:hypothetical protein Pint_24443 [Pistacia integerrima]